MRRSSATAPLTDLRHDEVLTISTRLGRCCNRGVDSERAWGALSLILFGAFAGGVYGAFPLWAANPSHQTKVYYVMAAGGALVLGVVSLVARLSVHKQRNDTVEAIKEDLDTILKSYELVPKPPDQR